jgi:hypothetical protein
MRTFQAAQHGYSHASSQGVGEIGLKPGVPDAIDLVFDLSNAGLSLLGSKFQ